MIKKADLHVHSNCSDGSNTALELIDIVKKNNIDIFALTDHDTIEGCLELKQLGFNDFIPSIELTCLAGEIKCHILGFNVDVNNLKLISLISKGKLLRRQKLETRIKFLRDVHNIELNKDELDWLYSRKSVVKTHLANIIVRRHLANNNIEAMNRYLDGCKCPNTRFDGKEGINTIIESNGIPVWAHPLGGEGEKHLSKDKFLPRLEEMVKYGIKGLECYYSRYNFDEIDFLVECANNNNLFITGGSDYHGTNKDIPIGRLNSSDKYIEPSKLTILKEILK